MFHLGFTGLEEVRDAREAASYDKAMGARFTAGMLERGVRLIGRGLWYVSGAHVAADVDAAIAAAREVFGTLGD
jgi:glutamate-1-semialdehyde 2,1-aminomutase